MKKLLLIIVLVGILIVGIFYGRGFWNKDNTPDLSNVSLSADKLIYESTVSPNENYAESKEEIVFHEVKVYQNIDNSIVVIANSNSALFDEMEYIVEYDKVISKSDVSIVWTTLMGNPEPTKEDQIALADVSISSNNEVFSERKINFFKKGIEIIVDAMKQTK